MTDADPERDRLEYIGVIARNFFSCSHASFTKECEVCVIRYLHARVRELQTPAAQAKLREGYAIALASAEERIAELEQDARRLDWLEAADGPNIEKLGAHWIPEQRGWWVSQPPVGGSKWIHEHGDTLRQAIDAAMAAERAEREK